MKKEAAKKLKLFVEEKERSIKGAEKSFGIRRGEKEQK